ncbi:MAG: serine/threonine-protein kinase [Nannocystaceae bacterium]
MIAPTVVPGSSRASEAAAATTPASRSRLGSFEGPLPSHVGPYRVIGHIGSGGVGVVYEARDEDLGRSVAVKVLRDASPANVARFRREARAMSRVNHPNVATVYEVGEDDGRGYISMELVRGQTLRQWLDSRPGWAEILAVVRQAAEGLRAAHAAGVVHRDFKPDNVLVGDDGRVRVVDFGLAKHHAELSADRADGRVFDRRALARELADTGITRTGSLMGTPAYMAPEQFRGEGDARSDQFALCVVLYEALYGVLPFPGETAEELFLATTRGRLRPWPKRDDLPIGLRPALRRGLSVRPADRHASVAALLESLTQAMVDGDGTPRRQPRTKGLRSWKWRIVGATTGLLLALGNAVLSDDAPSSEPAVAVQPVAPQVRTPQAPKAAPKATTHARTSAPEASRLRARRRPAQS